MEFLKGLRVAVSNGKEIIITVHPNAFSEDMVTRVRSEADVYFRTSSASIGNRRVKVIEKIKLAKVPSVLILFHLM